MNRKAYDFVTGRPMSTEPERPIDEELKESLQRFRDSNRNLAEAAAQKDSDE